jgi:hypothetical protein
MEWDINYFLSFGSFILQFKFMCSSMYVRKLSQFVRFVIGVGLIDVLIAYALILAITGELSEDSSELESTCKLFDVMPWSIKTSNKSGNLFRSVGQYVGSPVLRYLQFCLFIACKEFLPFAVVSLAHHSLCLAFQSPSVRNLDPRDWKNAMYCSADIACLGGQ